MGKQKIERLLEQLRDNQQQDIHNTAAIFTVAQGAINQLSQLEGELTTTPMALPAAPQSVTKADLIDRYGNYNACRKAAKQAGITFSQSPRWSQLVAAFSYLEACQTCLQAYLARYPNSELQGVSLTLPLNEQQADP